MNLNRTVFFNSLEVEKIEMMLERFGFEFYDYTSEDIVRYKFEKNENLWFAVFCKSSLLINGYTANEFVELVEKKACQWKT